MRHLKDFKDMNLDNEFPLSGEFPRFTMGKRDVTILSLTNNSAFNAVSAKYNAAKKFVTVKWATLTELNVSGFNIYRASKSKGAYTKLNVSPIPAKHAGTNASDSYTFKDKKPSTGKTYYYKVEAIRTDGPNELTSPSKVKIP